MPSGRPECSVARARTLSRHPACSIGRARTLSRHPECSIGRAQTLSGLPECSGARSRTLSGPPECSIARLRTPSGLGPPQRGRAAILDALVKRRLLGNGTFPGRVSHPKDWRAMPLEQAIPPSGSRDLTTAGGIGMEAAPFRGARSLNQARPNWIIRPPATITETPTHVESGTDSLKT